MEHFDASNVQFLDLTGIDDEEKAWILNSLQSRDVNVKGPWSKKGYQHHGSANRRCAPIETCTRNYQYQTPNVILSPLHQPVYTIYQSPPVYQSPYVARVQYPVVPVTAVVPVATPMVNHNVIPPTIVPVQFSQHVTYPNYPPIHTAEHIQITSTSYSQQDQVPDEPNLTVLPEINHNEVEAVVVEAQQVIHQTTNHVDIVNNVINGHVEKKSDEERTEPQTTSNNQNVARSWASLFNKSSSEVNGTSVMDVQHVVKSSEVVNEKPQENNTLVEAANHNEKCTDNFDDPNYFRMAECLTSHYVDHKVTSLMPRGLINRSNYCYINSILQALIACPPFYNLFHALSNNVTANKDEKRSHSQMIDNVICVLREFNPMVATPKGKRDQKNQVKKEYVGPVTTDAPFEPYWVYKTLAAMKNNSFLVEGRQEDAEEFLGCLLNSLNDEMAELMKLTVQNSINDRGGKRQPGQIGSADHLQRNTTVAASTGAVAASNERDDEEEDDDDGAEWQVMGARNRSTVTTRAHAVRTPLSDIFGGHIRSRLHRAGDHDADYIQPFFTLQLNIEKVSTVREALEMLVTRNQVEGVTSSKTKEEVEAWQQVTIEELPVVLILHLKCFDYKLDGCTKIVKALEFPVDLRIDSKLLSSSTKSLASSGRSSQQYKLFAVVYHDGVEASKGHYVTDAYHSASGAWLRYDDALVKAVSEQQVLQPQGNRVPYLLFYRRCVSSAQGSSGNGGGPQGGGGGGGTDHHHNQRHHQHYAVASGK